MYLYIHILRGNAYFVGALINHALPFLESSINENFKNIQNKASKGIEDEIL